VNRQIRRLGVVLLISFGAVLVQLSVIQVIRTDEYNEHPSNTRQILRDFSEPRGDITTADGVVIATSVEVDDRFELLRTYPEGELYAHSAGWFSFSFGAAGIEQTYNDELAGETVTQELRSLGDLLVERDRTGDVRLTLIDSVQRVARDALGEREGAVVALDPRDGSILAMWSYPSFDPNLLAGHDLDVTADVRDALLDADGAPLRASTYQERYFPGSTFKVVTGSAGVESGRVTPSEPSFPVTNAYTPPLTTRPIRNFGGSTCGGTLYEVMRVSCNTAFAEMGAETIGPEPMVERAEAFGFNSVPPIDLPAAAPSVFPTDFFQNTPRLAQASIGQNDVQATPLQMALVAAAIANDGRIMKPHLLDEIRDGEGTVVTRWKPSLWRRATSASTAAIIRIGMLGVVERGTASRLAIDGVEIGGKTGTAELGTSPPSSHAWIIAFAGPPGERPVIAVAVLVEGQPGVSEQTGGRVAAPIARAVIEAALASDQLMLDTDDPLLDAPAVSPPSSSGSPAEPTMPSTTGGPLTVAPTTAAPSTTAAATTTTAAATTTTAAATTTSATTTTAVVTTTTSP